GLPFACEFDSAVFYDSLHHAVDESAALRGAYRALRPGGVCVTSEPGAGHECSPEAREAVARYGVTEKSMPPRRVIELGPGRRVPALAGLPARLRPAPRRAPPRPRRLRPGAPPAAVAEAPAVLAGAEVARGGAGRVRDPHGRAGLRQAPGQPAARRRARGRD